MEKNRMNEEVIKDIFTSIAFYAMDNGREIRLEKGVNTSHSNVLNGAFSQSATDYDSLSLHVYTTNENTDEAEEDADVVDADVE